VTRPNTRERILEVALDLFNHDGEAATTTNAIADTLDISPGNLHYHFRTKQSLVDALFERFEQRMLALLSDDAPDRIEIDDAWLFLHLVFETIAEYRFIYRDLTDLCHRYDGLHRRMRGILRLAMRTADLMLEALGRNGEMDIDDDARETLVRTMILVASYWIAFDTVLEPDSEARPDRAAWQVMSLVSPYLEGEARLAFDQLGRAYRRS